MKLKKLEISGFKSFFEKAVIEFPSGITAVVGPNGCGKSNVIDAIRWVMGEQSVKQLRGKSMEDVIFSGTNGRAPLGMAEVSLTLANDNGSAPEELKDFTEINMTRRLYRSGESAYLLNKQPCRLKDIHNIFLGSGLGSRSYAFIQQGNIGVITEAGPEERRYFVEEAAGVTRYKHHKTEALRKIDITHQNLLRVADIIVEIKRQMNSLKRQARKAELFSKYQARAKGLDVRLGLHHFEELTRQIDGTEQMLQGLKDADLEHTTELKKLDAAVEEIKLERWQKNQAIADQKTEKFNIQRTIDRMEKDLEHLRGEIERLNRETADLQNSRQGLEQKNQGMLAEIEQGETENTRLREEIGRSRAGLEQERSALERMTAAMAGMNQELEGARARLLDLTAREAQYRNLYQNASNNRENLQRRLKRADETEALLHQKISEAQERESRAQSRLAAIKNAIAELSRGIIDIRERLDEKSRALAAQVKLAQSVELERSTTRSKHATLKKMEDNFEWYKDGVKAVMKRAQEGSDGRALAGIVGLVADVIEPEASAATAVEAALGESLQYVIVDDQQAGLAAIDYLQQQSAGRSGFVPVSALHDTAAGSAERPDPSKLLLQHVAVKPGFEPIAQALLGNVVLTETLPEALALFNQNGKIQTIVTRNGDVVSPRGFLIGGSKDAASGILAKKHELRELERQGKELEQKLEIARLEQRGIETEVRHLDSLNQSLETMNRKKVLYSAAMLVLLVGISTISVSSAFAHPGEAPGPPPPWTPPTTPEPPEPPGDGDTGNNNTKTTILTQIFKVMFDSSTMKDAIVNSIDSIFNDAVGNLTASGSPFYKMGSEISEIVFETDKLEEIRLSSWLQLRKVAFALLPLTAALTIWASMKDGLYSVTGYANTFEAFAEFFVAIAIAMASYWLMEQSISLTKTLTLAIAESLSVDITGSVYAGMFIKPAALGISNPGLSMILGIFSFALVLAYMVSVTIAFLAREVVLIMTVALAPLMIILGSVRPLSWLRGLWSKAFIVFLLLLPINVLTMGVAFKLWVTALSLASGPLATILQLTILAGTLSVLIAVNGTLGKLVYGAAIEVAQKVGKTLTSVASMAAGLAVGAVGLGALGGSALGGAAGAQSLAPVAGGGGSGLALGGSSAGGGVVTSTSNLTSTIGRTLSSSRSSAVSSLGRGMQLGAAVKDHQLATQSPPSSPQLNVAENGVPGLSKGLADVMGQIDTPRKAAAIGSDQATLASRVNLGAETSAATLEAVEGAGLSAGDFLRDTNYFNPGRPNIEMAGRDYIRSEAGSFALGAKSNYTQTALPGFTPRTQGIHSLDYQAAQRIVQSEQRVGNNYFSEISAAKMQDVAQAVRARRLSGTRSYDAIVNSAHTDPNIIDWINISKGLIS